MVTLFVSLLIYIYIYITQDSQLMMETINQGVEVPAELKGVLLVELVAIQHPEVETKAPITQIISRKTQSSQS